MLYDKNRSTPNLDKELFKKPTAEYRAAPFWAWNCDLDEKELLRQIEVFREMGFGGFHIHVRTGMSTPYLSDEFMKLISSCTGRAKDIGLLSWLYDEDRYASGSAGGLVTKNPEFRQRILCFSCKPDYQTSDSTLILGRYDIVLDESKTLSSYKMLADGENAVGTVWTVYREIAPSTAWYNNLPYVDSLNPKAMQRFIEVTHERYYETVGDEFGKTIPSIFTDEPKCSGKGFLKLAEAKTDVTLPWTDDFDETYTKAYGESIIEKLPELIWNLPGGEPSVTRYRYHDHVTERLCSAFTDQCGKWCDEHGILLTGHMNGEPTLDYQTLTAGDVMRAYRAFSLPGIDMLFGNRELNTAKQGQSAARQYGREGLMSELYGGTGWDFDFRGHKINADWQAAFGVTARVPHLSWVSMKGNAKRDYPASIFYQSSWHKEYAYIEDHFARVATALTRGAPVVKVGVIHPVESYWLHYGPRDQNNLVCSAMEENFKNLSDWLLRGCIDFDFICESLFPSQCERGSSPLKVGKMSYDVIVVPECETLRSTTLERLEDFLSDGGKLIFMGNAPRYENAFVSERGRRLFEKSTTLSFNRAAILGELAPYRSIDIRNPDGSYSTNLVHTLRRDNSGSWLFIAHLDDPATPDVAQLGTFRVTVFGKYVPELWDTMSGDIKPVEYRYDGENTVITLRLYDYDSALLFLADGEGAGYTVPRVKASESCISIPNSVPFSLDEPNVLLLDTAKYALDGDELQDTEEILRLDRKLREKTGLPNRDFRVAQPWVLKKVEPRYTVTLEFEIESEIDVENPVLALEDADKAKITFNGEDVVYSDIGYYTDAAIRKTALPAIKAGKNILTIKLPFDERENIECCYLLGDFGVKVNGRRKIITDLPKTVAFDDITNQGFPFYGGAITYHIPIECDGVSEYDVTTSHYRAGVLTYALDGEKCATVALPPYKESIGVPKEGNHTLSVTAYISRYNCFGNIHCADEMRISSSPGSWVTKDSSWTYEYRLRRKGIISSPVITKK
ncbi:MAG: hypothetical protein IKC34_02055 [Clostridia bacterium]|nr:hypothetical protein [Clostridia bacterium]